jgi:hypothetical protein
MVLPPGRGGTVAWVLGGTDTDVVVVVGAGPLVGDVAGDVVGTGVPVPAVVVLEQPARAAARSTIAS